MSGDYLAVEEAATLASVSGAIVRRPPAVRLREASDLALREFERLRFSVPGIPVVYVVQRGSTRGPFKIGRVQRIANLVARLEKLSEGCAEEIYLRRLICGDHDTETALHRRLAEHRMRGEWFRPVPAVVAVATIGVPA